MATVEFGTTGFCPAFQGAALAARSEALGFDVQLFGENHAMAPDIFSEMRAAAAQRPPQEETDVKGRSLA